MQTLQGVGWQWRTDGVVVTLQVDGKQIQVLVPLQRVWHEFSQALTQAGTPMAPHVSGPCTVGGLFSSIAHAVSHAVTAPVHAVTKAANAVVHTAVSTALHNPIANLASKAITAIPVVGPLANSVAALAETPLKVIDGLAHGGRIDKLALSSLKSSLANIKTIAPYAQLVLSAVPGIGTGLNAAIGAGLALASGQNISDALVAGVRSALPGGPLAAAAFDVAHAAMQGKPITAIALNALPISPAQKQALTQGLSLAKDLAHGKSVSQTLVDQALQALPSDLQKAVQVGGALAHAKSLQDAVGTLAHAASLSSAVANGVTAAKQVQQLVASRMPVPSQLSSVVAQGLAAHQLVQQHTAAAAKGVSQAKEIVNALNFHSAAQQPRPPSLMGPTPRAPAPPLAYAPTNLRNFSALFHPKVSGPMHKHHQGIHARFHNPHHEHHAAAMATAEAPRVSGPHRQFKARFHTSPHHHHPQSHVGAPYPRHMTFHHILPVTPQLPAHHQPRLRQVWRP